VTFPVQGTRPTLFEIATMKPIPRVILAVSLLSVGLVAQAALERTTRTERPPLKRTLATLPMRLGDWAGRDEPVDPAVLEKSQADDWLNRVYEQAGRPGRRVVLWINYSKHGLNLRHSPEVCLPGQGWTKVESQCRTLSVRCGEATQRVTRLGYAQGELVQGIGFWYYIFGEGRWEHYVRNLPITSRSSHGRTTRGSGLTVEVFCPGELDADGQLLFDFAAALLPELEPLLPNDRARYYIP
jgi:EpsI family protein